MTQKRTNYLEWQEYFMSIAFLSAQRSKDPATQVGACIVNKENKVVGIGYNGMPTGCSDDIMPWNKSDTNSEKWLESKLPYVCHAELNAVLNKNCSDVKDCIIYVALFPCNLCAQIIIQSRIAEVVFYCDKEPGSSETKAAKYLLDLAGIPYRQFVPNKPTVEIDFSLIEVFGNRTEQLPSQQITNGEVKPKDTSEKDNDKSYQQDNQCDEIVNHSSTRSQKRHSYLQWNEYFMAMAFLSAQRSKDPRTQVGACIVNKEKKIVGIGYNGMPIGCCDDVMPWNRAADKSDAAWLESKSPYVCHAELNAVLNKNSADIKGCTIYVALFPCNKCAQVVVQSGITEVIYYSDKYHDSREFKASRHLLSTAGVTYRQFRPRQEKIVIDFGICNASEENHSEPDLPIDASENEKDEDASKETDIAKGTNNNNISKKFGSTFLQDTISYIPSENAIENDQYLQESLEIGWINEVKEFRYAFMSFAVAAVVAALSWLTSSSSFNEYANL